MVFQNKYISAYMLSHNLQALSAPPEIVSDCPGHCAQRPQHPRRCLGQWLQTLKLSGTMSAGGADIVRALPEILRLDRDH